MWSNKKKKTSFRVGFLQRLSLEHRNIVVTVKLLLFRFNFTNYK